ncbi:MAG: sulfite exporter TauE/SafE family protein [Alphaproteobacteria bacterium]|nr:sulfite exporter TauE/SafE family protein [Alphaproteobacteria bacterium]
MQIYLPIAEMSVDAFLLLGLGATVGFLSGVFGVGGGFLLTPLLLFIGVPSPIAVASQANQLVASSVSGVLAQWRRGNVDHQIGAVMIAGGVVGAVAGVWLFGVLRSLGQIDLVISLCYVLFLGVIGGMMLVESLRAILKRRRNPLQRAKLHQHMWIHGLPLKMRFRKSKLYISALVPAAIGLFIGLLAAIMGVGGGFLMIPAMIYLLGMPTQTVVGTSLFQIIFVTATVTVLQAVQNQTVDGVLAALLLAGGVVGAQFGARAGQRLRGEQLRALLAVLVLAVCAKLLIDLFAPPPDVFSFDYGAR